MTRARTLARALGFLSLALGLVELVAPRRLARWTGLGVRSRDLAVRAIGARELGAAAGLLSRPMPVRWSWLRVGGDAMDLALLGRAARERGVRRDRLTAVLGAVAAVSILDLVASLRLTQVANAPRRAVDRAHRRERASGMAFGRGGDGLGVDRPGGGRDDEIGETTDWSGEDLGEDASTERRGDTTVGSGGESVRASVTVDRSPEEVYGLWRDFEAFPRFMRHVEKVEVSDDGRRSHWTAKAPAGSTVEWDAMLTEDRPNELISWRSIEGSGIHNAGTVRFAPAPAGRGTEVHVEMEYAPPAGPIGAVVAKLFGEEPTQQVREDVNRFKQIAEVGEVVRSEATVEGRRIRQRPAQPIEGEGGVHEPAGPDIEWAEPTETPASSGWDYSTPDEAAENVEEGGPA